MESRPIVVIGATGHVGRHAVAALHGRGRAVRAVARNPSATRHPAGVEAVAGDVSDPRSLVAAVDGAAAVFLVFPTLRADQHAPELVDLLAEHVDRVAYLSSEGASADRLTDPGILGSHSRLELLIRDSGLEWTFLRSGGMATNTLGWAEQVRTDGTVR